MISIPININVLAPIASFGRSNSWRNQDNKSCPSVQHPVFTFEENSFSSFTNNFQQVSHNKVIELVFLILF